MAELFAPPSILRTDRADGSILLRSTQPLGAYATSVGQWLRDWAARAPDQPLVAQRNADGAWDAVTYGEMRAAANAVGQALLDRGLSAQRPLLVLSGNSIGHLTVALAALTVGVPVAPVSVAYSLQSRDHPRIKAIGELVRPGAVYVEDAEQFASALAALGSDSIVLSARHGPSEHSLSTLTETPPRPAVEAAYQAVTGATLAKILFTSGSTGAPKGVITTHEMLCANQQMIRQAWPFLERERPVLVDWLPWSHTFGGSHNVNLVLANGGTLYIDDGRPTPELIGKSLANYADVPPTISFNVPAGYAHLVPALERDPALAARFFARLRLVFNAAAALPPALRDRLAALGVRTTGRPVPVTGSWGTTETAPAATTANFEFRDSRCIGAPLPGVTLKLLPEDADTYEVRVRGPNVTPGFFRRPDLAATAFDGEGFYCPGDAVSFADPNDPAAGLVFRGRLAEDFKLSTGTFVRVGALRTALLSAVPVLADAVLTGEDRDEVGALVWLNRSELPDSLTELDTSTEVIDSAALAAHLAPMLSALNAGTGSALSIARLLVLGRPPSLDAGEITDKGYLNQRQVLAHRRHLVELLYAQPAAPEVIRPAAAGMASPAR